MCVLAYLILIFLVFPILDCMQTVITYSAITFWRNSIFNVTNNVENAKVLHSKTYIFFFMKVFILVKVWNVHFSNSIDPFFIMKSTYTHNIVIYIKTYLRSNSTNIDLRGLISYSLFSCTMYTSNVDGKKFIRKKVNASLCRTWRLF